MDGKMENSEEVLMENSKKIVIDEKIVLNLPKWRVPRAMGGMQRRSRISSNGRGCEQRVLISGGAIDNGSISKAHTIKHALQPQNTSLERQVLCSNAHDESDQTEAPTCGQNGETWTCAGGQEIKKEGKVTVNQMTGSGVSWRGVCKVRSVCCTLINVDRVQATGRDMIVTKNQPRIVNVRRSDRSARRKAKASSYWTRGSRCRQGRERQRSVRILCGRGELLWWCACTSDAWCTTRERRDGVRRWRAGVGERRPCLIRDSQAGENEKNMM